MYNEELIAAKVAARNAGKILMKYLESDSKDIQYKSESGDSPVTIADNEADKYLSSFLGGELRHELGNIYEDLRGMAGESEIPVWTASQANRSALEEDIIEAQKISESYAKVMIADFVISLSRKIADKVANTGRWHIIKNRFGPDGLTFPSKMDTSTGIIHIFDEMSIGGKEQQKKMDNSSEYLRKMLSKKLKDSTI